MQPRLVLEGSPEHQQRAGLKRERVSRLCRCAQWHIQYTSSLEDQPFLASPNSFFLNKTLHSLVALLLLSLSVDYREKNEERVCRKTD
jgi:hypothetical protein